MIKRKRGVRRIDNMAVLLLFLMFAVGVMCVLLCGAGSYKKIVENCADSTDIRSGIRYLQTKLRRSGGADCVSLEERDGEAVLVIREETESGSYVTRIYCEDGWLRELFSAEGDWDSSAGEPVLEMRSLSGKQTGGLLSLTLRDTGGQTETVVISLPAGEEAPE